MSLRKKSAFRNGTTMFISATENIFGFIRQSTDVESAYLFVMNIGKESENFLKSSEVTTSKTGVVSHMRYIELVFLLHCYNTFSDRKTEYVLMYYSVFKF